MAMFLQACRTASKFTFPVIILQRTVDGKCSGTVGAFIVLNDEGWIVTCYHIAKIIVNGYHADAKAKSVEAQQAAIKTDASLSSKERQRKLAALPGLRNNDIARMGIIWAVNLAPPAPLSVAQFCLAPAVDLAIGKMDNFDPKWVSSYPIIKDPARDFEQGASLCRFGYPFHDIVPTWESATDRFDLPNDAFPIPQFVMDGILTRLINVQVPNFPDPPPFPMMYFETSTPGLQGQSGGPVFDSKGTVLGVQSHTAHYALGFNPPVPKSMKGEKEYQFLNVGRCIHAESIIGLLRIHNVKHNVSIY
jgi:hypothetical protein